MRSRRTSRRLCLLLLFALVGSVLHAQDMERKKRPKRSAVVLYKDQLASQFDTVKSVKNVVKLNPLLFFRGEIPIYYERALTPHLGIEAGIGFTWRNYLNVSFVGDATDADDYGAGTDLIARPSYHLATRWYFPNDIEPQGTYAQIEFAHVEYVKDISRKDSSGFFSDVKDRDNRIYNDIRLLIGYQRLSVTSNWLFDLYGGLAFRDRHLDVVKETLDLSHGVYNYATETTDDITAAFFLGIKVGLGF
ncbi:MAG: hypothetical protein H6597_05665 [Flavobacteriales bacterium]|nr:hypothetical protein [Flavobacteriales bacterium]